MPKERAEFRSQIQELSRSIPIFNSNLATVRPEFMGDFIAFEPLFAKFIPKANSEEAVRNFFAMLRKFGFEQMLVQDENGGWSISEISAQLLQQLHAAWVFAISA